MKFKVGQKVRLKPFLEVGKFYGAIELLDTMKHKRIMTIQEINEEENAYCCSWYYWGDNRSYWYSEEMLELFDDNDQNDDDYLSMNAITYLQEISRICDSYLTCSECSVKTCKYFEYGGDPKELVKSVYEWSKEHPRMTNLDKFKEVSGEHPTYSDEKCGGCDKNINETPCFNCSWWNEPYQEP